ncbi:MAG: prepilin-type N-terminal cleavage/methylation domain-containing protein [Planctomycetota bacterium]
MYRTRAFTLIELLVVISIIALLIALLLPALAVARKSARQVQSTTHLRGMHQALVIHAQSNNSYYPGLDSSGERFIAAADNYSATSGGMVQGRMAIMIEEDLVTPDYLINPAEPEIKSPYDIGSGDTFDTEHYSYAMMNITGPRNDSNYPGLPVVNPTYGRYVIQEWQDNMNSEAVIMGDRLLEVRNNNFTNPPDYLGFWSKEYGDSKWGIVWNDNRAEFNTTPFFETKYGGISNSNDDIFTRGLNFHGNTQTPSGQANPNSAANCFLAAKLGDNITQ